MASFSSGSMHFWEDWAGPTYPEDGEKTGGDSPHPKTNPARGSQEAHAHEGRTQQTRGLLV